MLRKRIRMSGALIVAGVAAVVAPSGFVIRPCASGHQPLPLGASRRAGDWVSWWL